MATNNKLTKFKSATTIVTADYANSIFGGLYGSSEADSLSADDPRVVGHIHDGGNADGHARKIDLVDHVDNQLLNQNLADNAVTKRNVRETEFPSEAIPESEEIDGTTYYYLDLRGLRGDLVFVEDDSENTVRQRSQTFDGTSYVDIAGVWSTTTGRDFVFGSSSLEDLASGTDGNNRFFFDKSKGAFRAGIAQSAEWDNANRGLSSVAFGRNTIASGQGSFAVGNGPVASGNFSAAFGDTSTASGDYSTSRGSAVTASGTHSFASGQGSVASGVGSFAFGTSVTASGGLSFAFGSNSTAGGLSSASFGDQNSVTADYGFASGIGNEIGDNYSAAFGVTNVVKGELSFSFGAGNLIDKSAEEYHPTEVVRLSSAVGGDSQSYAYGQHSQASGTFDPSQPPLNTYPTLDILHFPGPWIDWHLYTPLKGGAQTFTLTMFGNFQYPESVIDTANASQKVIAQLDNFQAIPSDRPFRPRKNASYSIKTLGTISFTKPAVIGDSVRHSVSFITHSGITVQHDGSMFYSTDTLQVIYDSLLVSGATPLDLVLPGTTAATDDFRLYFTHDVAAPTNRSPGLLPPPGVTPPGHGFSFVLEKRTFLNKAVPGTTTSQEVYYGEAISVRMEVTELNINIVKSS